MSKVTKELLIKTVCLVFGIALVMFLVKITGLVDIVSDITKRITNPSTHPASGGEWAILFGYRILIYFALPTLLTIFELIFFKNKRHLPWVILNFEAQFIALSIVCGIYYVFALDYAAGTKILTIEHSVTSLLLLFFTILLGKKFPHIFISDEKEAFHEE